MSIETWGEMPKAQDDNQKIEERIAEMIEEHDNDPEAHLGETGSLQSHKASEIIDHLAESIVEDKLEDLAVGPAKFFDFTWNRFYINLESIDSWYVSGNHSLYFGTLEISRPSSGLGECYARTEDYGNFRWDKDIVFRCVASLSDTTSQVGWFGVGAFDQDSESQGIGFKVVNGTLYAFHSKIVDGDIVEYTTEIDGINIQNQHVYSFYLTAESEIDFYIDNVHCATHSENLPVTEYRPQHMIFLSIRNTALDAKFLTVSSLYVANKI